MTTNTTPLKVTLSLAKMKPTMGQGYNVSFNGEQIVSNSRDPEHDACRVLANAGHTGPLEVYRAGQSYPSLRIRDLQKAAKVAVQEPDRGNLRLGPWVPYRPAA